MRGILIGLCLLGSAACTTANNTGPTEWVLDGHDAQQRPCEIKDGHGCLGLPLNPYIAPDGSIHYYTSSSKKPK